MRYDCTEPDFQDCFVQFSDSWTRKDVREFWADIDGPQQQEAWLALVQSKIASCYLTVTAGEPITSGLEITEEAMDARLDIRLYKWFQSALVKAAVDVAELGNAAGRRLFVSPETTAAGRPNPS